MHRTAFAFGLGFAALMAGTAMAQDAGTPTKEMLSKAQTGKDNAGTWPGKPAIDFGPGDTGVWAHCSDCTHTKAYDAAEVYGTNPNRGVVLHLHDCRGLNIDKGWQREWLDYLKLNGFVVIAIDSFADVRPQPLVCKKDPWLSLFTKMKTYGIRKRQAEYAVKKIREKYPGQRIFVWGHGEGGVTAQLVGEEIDGVISTGASCSTEWLAGIAQTPLLVIQGTDDANLQDTKKSLLYDSLDDRCKIHMDQPKWEWLTVKGMGHAAELSRKNVKRRIKKFLGIPNG